MQHNKQYHRKVLLSSFHLNGHWHSLGFHLQTQKLEASCATKYTALQGRTLSSFHLKGHTRRYVIHSPNVGKALCSIINSTTAKYCSKAFNGHNSHFTIHISILLFFSVRLSRLSTFSNQPPFCFKHTAFPGGGRRVAI